MNVWPSPRASRRTASDTKICRRAKRRRAQAWASTTGGPRVAILMRRLARNADADAQRIAAHAAPRPVACCIATAQAMPSAALVSSQHQPSPVVLISTPLCAAAAVRSAPKCARPQRSRRHRAQAARQLGRADEAGEDDVTVSVRAIGAGSTRSNGLETEPHGRRRAWASSWVSRR
jgi:hypothetical protein